MELNNDKTKLRILLVEDSVHDRKAFHRAFNKNGFSFDIQEFDKAETAMTKLSENPSSFDIVVSDYGLPGMKGLDFLKKLLSNKTPIPLVLLTGSGTEQIAIEALKAGVDDYIIKDDHGRYLELLPVTLQKVVEKHRDHLLRIKAEEEKEKLVQELQKALANVKTLSGFLPICASCKKIRDDDGYWNQIEIYLKKHSEVDFTHSICPECMKTRYGSLFDDDKSE